MSGYTLKLTKRELEHLRNIMSLSPGTGGDPFSNVLAHKTGHDKQETSLWRKIWSLCESANIPVGKDAPDFLVNISTRHLLDIVEYTHDDDDEDDDE